MQPSGNDPACPTLVLQSWRTIAQARELAAELLVAWSRAPSPDEEVVRRYQRDPFMVRDALTSLSTGRQSALAPHSFHALLLERVDLRAGRQAG